jgi:hypothetical protein
LYQFERVAIPDDDDGDGVATFDTTNLMAQEHPIIGEFQQSIVEGLELLEVHHDVLTFKAYPTHVIARGDGENSIVHNMRLNSLWQIADKLPIVGRDDQLDLDWNQSVFEFVYNDVLLLSFRTAYVGSTPLDRACRASASGECQQQSTCSQMGSESTYRSHAKTWTELVSSRSYRWKWHLHSPGSKSYGRWFLQNTCRHFGVCMSDALIGAEAEELRVLILEVG